MRRRNMAAVFGLLAFMITATMNVTVRADPNDCETGCGVGSTTGSGSRATEACSSGTCLWKCCSGDTGTCAGWGSPNCIDKCGTSGSGWLSCGDMND